MYRFDLSLYTIQLCLTIQTKYGFIANEFLLLTPILKENIRKNKNGTVTNRSNVGGERFY